LTVTRRFLHFAPESFLLRLSKPLFVILLAALALQCGQSRAPRPALPEAAFAPIAEDEFANFSAALPGFVSALKAAGYQPRSVPNENIASGLARIIRGMEGLPGVADSLAAKGMTWPEFSTTLYKVMTTAAAIAVDMTFAADSSLPKRTKDKGLESDRALAARVPESNREFLTSHQNQLAPLSRLGGD